MLLAIRYLQNIPGNPYEFDKNKYCFTGCFYAFEKYMKDKFKIKLSQYNIVTKDFSINSPGLNNSILQCCKAFLDHQLVLLSNNQLPIAAITIMHFAGVCDIVRYFSHYPTTS